MYRNKSHSHCKCERFKYPHHAAKKHFMIYYCAVDCPTMPCSEEIEDLLVASTKKKLRMVMRQLQDEDINIKSLKIILFFLRLCKLFFSVDILHHFLLVQEVKSSLISCGQTAKQCAIETSIQYTVYTTNMQNGNGIKQRNRRAGVKGHKSVSSSECSPPLRL